MYRIAHIAMSRRIDVQTVIPPILVLRIVLASVAAPNGAEISCIQSICLGANTSLKLFFVIFTVREALSGVCMLQCAGVRNPGRHLIAFPIDEKCYELALSHVLLRIFVTQTHSTYLYSSTPHSLYFSLLLSDTCI